MVETISHELGHMFIALISEEKFPKEIKIINLKIKYEFVSQGFSGCVEIVDAKVNSYFQLVNQGNEEKIRLCIIDLLFGSLVQGVFSKRRFLDVLNSNSKNDYWGLEEICKLKNDNLENFICLNHFSSQFEFFLRGLRFDNLFISRRKYIKEEFCKLYNKSNLNENFEINFKEDKLLEIKNDLKQSESFLILKNLIPNIDLTF